jgi:hypothetical protein
VSLPNTAPTGRTLIGFAAMSKSNRRCGLPSQRHRRWGGLLAAGTAALLAGCVHSSDIAAPRHRGDVLQTVVPPSRDTCHHGMGFDVKLAERPELSQIDILRRDLPWAGESTVSEFSPAAPMPPFSRFFFHESPLSHQISWSMGTAFFATPALASDAASQWLGWYAKALHAAPVSSGTSHRIRTDGLTLMILVDGSAVRVSCEHQVAVEAELREAFRHRE